MFDFVRIDAWVFRRQMKLLKRLAAKQGVPVAYLFRRAIDMLLKAEGVKWK